MIIGGTADHVHLLFNLSRTHTIAEVVEAVKTGPSKWIKTKAPKYRNFYWQEGYGIFSVGQSSAGAVRKYIATQKEHHRKTTFKEEFRKMLIQCGIEFDERYIWD